MRRGLAALVLLTLCVATAPARADVVDGHWCRANKHFSIEGPQIVTPAGTKMQGDYDRHGFSYTAPPGEPEAGTRIVMVLQGEETLELTHGAPQAANPPETWRRCAAPTS